MKNQVPQNESRGEIAERALRWCRANDGGRLGVWWPCGSNPNNPDDTSQPIMAVMWDSGGTGELGVFYDKGSADDMETICDIFNWALDQLVPSIRGFYGDRTYVDPPEPRPAAVEEEDRP